MHRHPLLTSTAVLATALATGTKALDL